jgi:hypothetical protein
VCSWAIHALTFGSGRGAATVRHARTGVVIALCKRRHLPRACLPHGHPLRPAAVFPAGEVACRVCFTEVRDTDI